MRIGASGIYPTINVEFTGTILSSLAKAAHMLHFIVAKSFILLSTESLSFSTDSLFRSSTSLVGLSNNAAAVTCTIVHNVFLVIVRDLNRRRFRAASRRRRRPIVRNPDPRRVRDHGQDDEGQGQDQDHQEDAQAQLGSERARGETGESRRGHLRQRQRQPALLLPGGRGRRGDGRQGGRSHAWCWMG